MSGDRPDPVKIRDLDYDKGDDASFTITGTYRSSHSRFGASWLLFRENEAPVTVGSGFVQRQIEEERDVFERINRADITIHREIMESGDYKGKYKYSMTALVVYDIRQKQTKLVISYATGQ